MGVEDNADKERLKQVEQLKNDYFSVFLKNKAGARVLQDLLSVTGFFDAEFSKDPYENARLVGKREVGQFLLHTLNMKTYEGLLDLEDAGVEFTQLARAENHDGGEDG